MKLIIYQKYRRDSKNGSKKLVYLVSLTFAKIKQKLSILRFGLTHTHPTFTAEAYKFAGLKQTKTIVGFFNEMSRLKNGVSEN